MKVLAGRFGKASLAYRDGSGLGGASLFPKGQSRPHQEDDQENASERKGAVTRQIHGKDIPATATRPYIGPRDCRSILMTCWAFLSPSAAAEASTV